MTYPAVHGLPEVATSTLLGICAQLSRSRHPGLARWASDVSDALIIQLVSVTTGVHVDGASDAPCPLKSLAAAELEGLHALLLAGAEASEDESVVAWCTKMNGLIVADFCRRELEQAAFDAKAAAIVADERRLACLARASIGRVAETAGGYVRE